jgi:predicted Rossmann-fold nucleotide-binding protein
VESDRPAAKPVGVLDVGEFWQPLLSLFDVTMHKHILKAKNRELILDDAARCSTAS